jgi:hypothetical protein
MATKYGYTKRSKPHRSEPKAIRSFNIADHDRLAWSYVRTVQGRRHDVGRRLRFVRIVGRRAHVDLSAYPRNIQENRLAVLDELHVCA